MSEAVTYEQLDQPPATPGGVNGTEGTGAPPGADLHRLSDVPMELSVEIGRTRMTVGETLQLRAGSIVTLERLAGEPVDLLVNGTPLARGEVVIVDEEFGLRVTEIVEDDPAAVLGEPEGEDTLRAGGEREVQTHTGGSGDPLNSDPTPPPAQGDPTVQE